MNIKIKEFLEKNRETAQLVYGVVLIILIPLLIAFNTVFIIKKYNRSIDIILQRQALSMGRSISTLMRGDVPWEYFIQAKLEALIENNVEIMELSVLRPEDEDFKIIASTNKDDIGQITKSYLYTVAWLQSEDGGYATDSIRLAQSGQELEFAIDNREQERFWLVAMPMRDASEKKQALLAIKLSSAVVDELTNYNRNASIYLLIGTVFVVVLFLMIAVRLWDYVLLYKKTKEVDQMKDEFISMASHELRTPVTGIKGYVSMVLDGEFGQVSDKVKENLSLVKNTTERLATLVDDLLNVSRIEQGRLKIDLKPRDVSTIIKETLAELKVQAKEKQLALNYKPQVDKLPAINIDHDRFKQVLINLIGNAIKYTQAGSVEVLTEDMGKMLEIRIKDTGIGMSAKEREQLFEKFYRVQSEETRKITGTGLGLWIVKQIVELMRGKIMIDSIKNVGTQVTLQFPIVKK